MSIERHDMHFLHTWTLPQCSILPTFPSYTVSSFTMYLKTSILLSMAIACDVLAVPNHLGNSRLVPKDIGVRSAASFSVIATKTGGSYIMPIKVGSQSFNVIVDTGSQGL